MWCTTKLCVLPQTAHLFPSLSRTYPLFPENRFPPLRRGGKRFSGNRGYVLDRDGNKCAVCGSTQSLVVHHIDGYSENNPRNNKANKLITLCGKCHYSAHHIKSFIPAEILEEIGYFD